jgi:hypothetical protein
MVVQSHRIGNFNKPIVYPAANQCIYCGDKKPPLSKEHIIPLGLGGSFQLPKASCESCRKATHQFETICLREGFLNFRTHLKLPSRRPKDRPTHLPLRRKDESVSRLVPIADHPNFLVMPEFFDQPGIFLGLGPTSLILCKWNMYEDKIANQTLALMQGKISVDVKFSPVAFCLMLAKIAHGTTWAEFGSKNFIPFLPDLILRKNPDLASYLIGQAPTNRTISHSNMMHECQVYLQEHNLGHVVGVYIKLFSSIPTPTYSVVVGELIPSPEILTRYGLVKEGHKIIAAPQ